MSDQRLYTELEITKLIEDAKRELLKDLVKAHRERDEAKHRARVAEWAVVGVASYNVRVDVDPRAMAADSYREACRHIAKNAADHLLHGAKLAFKEWATATEMRRYINYLESQCMRFGTPFVSWEKRQAEYLAIPLRGDPGDPREIFKDTMRPGQ